jgi:hypothetical protein
MFAGLDMSLEPFELKDLFRWVISSYVEKNQTEQNTRA